MKNLFKFGFLALAITLSAAACNSTKTDSSTADSIDSGASASIDSIDSSASAKTDTIDSAADATVDSIK
ncbi:hypothetical protein ADIARSV_0981 [Arcticibacter svalbardensis MN12-7]|uniref:Entericidin n=1 Tax=Arcticibacter svalbardensis MN12-7 TaxID=1150600 RepID=R9H3S4_9SPHI|nr:hypothetical protein [Arcticibacter svalbardensis]EOR95844.1 hypothetical protein ADIARSV_0981 [Arcticibacter svalbardensis MN12-7]